MGDFLISQTGGALTGQVSEPSENGRRYRTEARFTLKPKEEWVAVSVPYSAIPREVVDAARVAIKDNRVPSRGWGASMRSTASAPAIRTWRPSDTSPSMSPARSSGILRQSARRLRASLRTSSYAARAQSS
jgi:hypothetical protein